ncbi:MAG: hypothetical protein R3C11_08160 [Planctomycetaceae bacterium]
MKWTITHGGADQFIFTVPGWLKGKLEPNGTGIRQAVESETDDGKIRWVIETQKLQQQEYFLTALSTLELPAEEAFRFQSLSSNRLRSWKKGFVTNLLKSHRMIRSS